MLSHKSYASREDYDRALVAELDDRGVALVCLAGFMRLLSPVFVDAFPNRILNIHPSLLPKYPGLHPQQQALDDGARESGATVHFVNKDLDAGPIVMQQSVPIVQAIRPTRSPRESSKSNTRSIRGRSRQCLDAP